ncbi:unnamed protein product [Soboliphyme baturini]|uniref:glutathione transferase n=1 Tax=Soboliphyme baturini TaxID=241478 RepID=A0A183IZT0_9BILA|nr:unnamed protein product [Soboliphyme baturini]
MVHEYKLSYFPIRGLAESIRLMLHDNEVTFVDDRISKEDWPKFKPKMQFGQMPCLYDNGVQYVQSGAIIRHLARQIGMYGSDEHEATMADMMYEGVGDIRNKYAKLIYTDYSEENKAKFISELIPPNLESFEKLLGGKKFVCGDKVLYQFNFLFCVTFADYALFEILDCLVVLSSTILDKYPHLKAYHAAFGNRPHLKAYMNSDLRKNAKINGNGIQ